MNFQISKKQPSLVGIVPRRNLWLKIQEEKWYHIPVKVFDKLYIDDVSSIEYLAFYFPKCFDEENRNKVIYYSKVLNIDTKKRIELFPDESRHKSANEDYYQLYLGEIVELPRAIRCRRKRKIIHILTSRQKLFTAKEINDLWDGNPLEEKMYQSMKNKKIIAERQFFVEVGEEKYFLDFGIFCRRGKIDIECDGKKYHTNIEALAKDRIRNNYLASNGWYVLRFSSQEINHNIKNCIDIIKKTIDNLGGVVK